MRDEVHATYRRRSRELPFYCADRPRRVQDANRTITL
jgi:hypothetical protein